MFGQIKAPTDIRMRSPLRSQAVGRLAGEREDVQRGVVAVGSDVEPLLDEMLHLLGPQVPTWRAYVNDGASASLSVVGEVPCHVADAHEHEIYWCDPDRS